MIFQDPIKGATAVDKTNEEEAEIASTDHLIDRIKY
jgi:hypothetical protein